MGVGVNVIVIRVDVGVVGVNVVIRVNIVACIICVIISHCTILHSLTISIPIITSSQPNQLMLIQQFLNRR